MKITKIIVITIFLSTLVYCQNDPIKDSYNSTSGITLSVFIPLAYSIGYNFVLNSHSTLSTSAYFFTNSSDDRRNSGYARLTTGEYNQWEDSYSHYTIGISLYYLHDIYKYSESKLYIGAGTKFDYDERNYEYSRELNLINLDEQSSMTNFQDHKRISLDFLVGYEYSITENIKIFSEAIYYFLWDNTKETITDGWDRQMTDLGDIENTGLSPTRNDVKKYLTNSRKFNLRVGLILSL